MGQARQRGDHAKRVEQAMARLPQHQRHVALIFDESPLALQALQQLMRDPKGPFHDTLRRNVPVLREQGACFILFFGTEGYTGGTTIGVRSLAELLEEGLPALFHRLNQKGAHTCAFAVAVDPSIDEVVKQRIAELQPQFDADGRVAASAALEGFEARLRAQRNEPIYGGTTIEPDQIVLDAHARQRVTAHFSQAAAQWKAQNNPAAAAATLTPFAERLPDGSLRLYSTTPAGDVLTLDFSDGEWMTQFEQARAMAGQPEWPKLHEPMHTLHGGTLIGNDAYTTPDGSRVRSLLIECVTEWARFGMNEVQRMRAADRQPFMAEVMSNGDLRFTAYFPSREFRVANVVAGEWELVSPTEQGSDQPSEDELRISIRPVLPSSVKGESVPFYLHRTIIDSRDTGLPLEALARAANSLESALPLRQRVFIEIGGYDDDLRQLWEIPEVVEYFRRLFNAWPYWLYFLETDKSEVLLLLSLLCEREPTSRPGVTLFRNPTEVQSVLARLEVGVRSLLDRWGLADDHGERSYISSKLEELRASLASSSHTPRSH